MNLSSLLDIYFVLCVVLAVGLLVLLIIMDKKILLLLLYFIWQPENTAFCQSRFDVVDECVELCETEIPKDLLRAVLWQESGWRQYNKDGSVFRGSSGEIGVGQLLPSTIRDRKGWSIALAKNSTFWNVQYSAWFLERKLEWIAEKKKIKIHPITGEEYNDWPKLHRAHGVLGYSDLEIAVRCYNGLTHSTKYVESVRRYWVEKPWRKKLKTGGFKHVD